MKKKIYTTVIRLALITMVMALLIDQLFVRVILPDQHEFSNVKKIKKLIERDTENEIPILGSSVAKRSYYPDSIGQGYFNYGMAGSVFVMVEPLLNIELQKIKDTPIIIDFEHHFFLSHDMIRMQVSNYIPHVDNKEIRSMLEERGLMKYQYDIPGLRLFGQYDEYLLDLLRLKFNREYENKGGLFFKPRKKDFTLFRERRQRMIDELYELRTLSAMHPELMNKDKERKMELLDILLNSRSDTAYIARFEKILKENSHRDFILVYSPQHRIKLQGLENYDEVLKLLSSLNSSHDNLHVFDHSADQYPDEYFHDSGHLNILGARKFSLSLRDDMRALYPDRPSFWTPQLLDD